MKTPPPTTLAVAANALAAVGVLLVMCGLVGIMYRFTRPAPVDQAWLAERSQNLAALNAQTRDWLENYAWIDSAQDRVRLPIARAMELMAREWQNPAAARSNLLRRLEQAALAPAAPPASPPTNASAGGKLK